MLRVLDTKKKTALRNMEIDRSLLEDLSSNPILHLYEWEGASGTYGYFINPEKHIKKSSISFARRPTGGGIVFHIWDYAFSFLMPATHPLFFEKPLDNYLFVNGVVLKVLEDLFDLKNKTELIPTSYDVLGKDCQNFCMARPTQYDVVYKGTKIAGAAQRKTKKGYLHQGTISLCLPDEMILRETLVEEDVIMAMLKNTFAPLSSDQSSLPSARFQIGQKLKEGFEESLLNWSKT